MIARKSKYRSELEKNPALVNEQNLKELTNTIDDMLKTLITMSSALLAIGVIFDDIVASKLVRLIVILLFFIGLVIAFLGILPSKIHYDLGKDEGVKAQHMHNLIRKRRHLKLSALILASGFMVIISDIIIELVQDFPKDGLRL